MRIDGVLELAGALCVVGAIGGTLTGSSDTGWRLLAAAIEVAILAIIARLSSVGLAIVRADNRIVFTSLATDLLLGGLVVGSIALRHGLHIGDHRRALVATSILFVVGVARRIAERRQQSDGVWLRVDVDDLLMRAVDVLLSFPFLLLLMALAAAIDRTSQTTICLVLGLTSWAGVARVVRSKTLQVARRDYVVAARALGQRAVVIAVRHVMPNVAGTVIVLATGLVGSMIVAEAALAFLGLSVPPPAASWGRMLDEGRPYVSDAPWVLGAPAAAILLSVLGFNLLGEGLRDAFDPRDSRG